MVVKICEVLQELVEGENKNQNSAESIFCHRDKIKVEQVQMLTNKWDAGTVQSGLGEQLAD